VSTSSKLYLTLWEGGRGEGAGKNTKALMKVKIYLMVKVISSEVSVYIVILP
jgi:hypothetical protein